MKKLLVMAALLPTSTLSTGCIPWWWFDDDDDVDVPPPTTQVENQAAPSVEVELADWPPPGPETLITIAATDDFGLSSVGVSFVNDLTFSMSGTVDEVTVRAGDLGEGLGFLDIDVMDVGGAVKDTFISNLLIDLTPPEITLGDAVVRHAADSDIEMWVADAWILGHVELAIGDSTLVYDFEDGYPETLGESWDYSLVKFATTAFAEGTNEAAVTLYDAAGNSTRTELLITLDGQAPLVAITAPQADAVLSGPFDVTLSATDAGGGPVWVELRVEGSPVATAVGPEATISLDTADFTPGSVSLEAIAIDQAGNESVLASVPVVVQ